MGSFALLRGLGAWLLILAACCGACSKRERCEAGRCPPGHFCDRASDRCLPSPAQPADAGQTGRWASAASLGNGTVLVASQSADLGALVLTRLPPRGNLSHTVVDRPGPARSTSGSVGRWSSLAVDVRGNPRIAYQDSGTGRLKYAAYNGQNWEIEVVPPGEGLPPGPEGIHASLVLMEDGSPAVAHHHLEAGCLLLSVRKEGTWTTEVVDLGIPRSGRPKTGGTSPAPIPARPSGGVGWYASAALDTSNRLRIAYYDADRGDLKLATRDGKRWRIVVVDGRSEDGRDTGDVGLWASLAFDKSGSFGIAYTDAARGRLLYAYNDRGLVKRELVDSGAESGAGIAGQFAKLAFDIDGTARIVYLEAAGPSPRVAVRERTGRWTTGPLVPGVQITGGLWIAHVALPGGGFAVGLTELGSAGLAFKFFRRSKDP